MARLSYPSSHLESRKASEQGSALIWVMSISAITTILSVGMLNYTEQQLKLANTSKSSHSFSNLIQQFKVYIYQSDVCNQTFADMRAGDVVTVIRNNPTAAGELYSTQSGALFPLSDYQVRGIRLLTLQEMIDDARIGVNIGSAGEGSAGVEVQAVHKSMINPANPIGPLLANPINPIYGQATRTFRVRLNAIFERDITPLVSGLVPNAAAASSICTVPEANIDLPVSAFSNRSIRQVAIDDNVIVSTPTVPMNSTYLEGSFQSPDLSGGTSFTCLVHSVAARISSCGQNAL